MDEFGALPVEKIKVNGEGKDRKGEEGGGRMCKGFVELNTITLEIFLSLTFLLKLVLAGTVRCMSNNYYAF